MCDRLINFLKQCDTVHNFKHGYLKGKVCGNRRTHREDNRITWNTEMLLAVF